MKPNPEQIAGLSESDIDVSRPWYFGNNRSRNLRLVNPTWSSPFFLTRDFSYAKNYADFGVYKIDLKDETELNILDFSNQDETSKLGWPAALIDKVNEGRTDLNDLAYQLNVLAPHKRRPASGELHTLADTPEWRAIATAFREKAKILQKAARTHWGRTPDEKILLQMWKDIFDAGFQGFTHMEFNRRIMAIFSFRCIDKITVRPVGGPEQS